MVLASAEAVRPPERIDVPTAAERYHIVKTAGQHAGPFSLAKTPYLREPMECLTSLDYTGMIFAGPARTGKALPLDTPVATPTGWITMGELRPGDRVFDERGEPCAVVAATSVMRDHECYRVEFDDGSSIIADAGHRWQVDDIYGVAKVLTTEAIRDALLPRRSRFAVPLAAPLFGRWNHNLPVDPYTLGAWLGDGSASGGYLTLNEWDIRPITAVIEESGADTSNRTHHPTKSSWTVRVAADGESLRAKLKRIGLLNNKHIPQQYLRACEEQRRQLLRGLMDTDGHAQKRQPTVEWSTSFPSLLADVQELLSSLSIKFTTSSKVPRFRTASGEHREGATSYRISFTPERGEDVFALPRQVEVWSLARTRSTPKLGHTRRRWIKAVVPVSSVPVRCIQVDSPSHLFLAGRQMVPTHNSSMFINWLCHTAITDPSDMMIVHMSQQNAREWSQGDLAKAIRNSPELAKRLRPGKQNDNVYDKSFLSGMRLSVTWPTIKNLSGKTIRYCWIMDSDRIKPQLIDNEAHVYDATKTRTRTFKRFGMTVAEASPGFPVKDAKWIANANEPHEAPPCDGILSLYNRGDRRRWFWQCFYCGGTFEPRFKLLWWPESADLMEAAEQVELRCPHCYHDNKDPFRFSDLPELNSSGRWLKEGQFWQADGTITGTPRRSDIASFWMFGPAAGLASDWKHLVLTYLRAVQDFEKTGNDANLMTTINVDQGEAYVPPALLSGMLPDTLKARAEDWGGHDPEGVPYLPLVMKDGGFLLNTIDVQGGGRPSFVVHTFAVTAGFDVWHVDMRKITKSERRDPETNERYLIDPAAHPEDWDVLVKQVMEYTYPLPDGSGRRMGVKMTVCDSGGKAGVTRNAYEFYHRLREQNQHARFHLLAGRPSKNDTATIRLSYQENWWDMTKRYAAAMGAIPLWLVNSNIVKDAADAKLRRAEPGGMIHFPTWAPDWLYGQLTTEVRDADKGWLNPNNKRNEAWDLLCYCIAFCDHADIRIRYLDWSNPPPWAAGWDRNDLVVAAGEQPFQSDPTPKATRSLADLARDFG